MGSRAFNFGIPQLPYISGREFAGEIVSVHDKSTRLKQGDRVSYPCSPKAASSAQQLVHKTDSYLSYRSSYRPLIIVIHVKQHSSSMP